MRGAIVLGSARRRITASMQRGKTRRTVVDQRPPLLCEPDDGPARPDAGPPRERPKHPAHGRFSQEAERNHPPRDQEGVTVWAVVSPLQLGARAAVESSECPPPGARNALSPLVVEASSRLSEREEEEPGRDRLEVERRMRCQVGREVQSPVDERVGDQYAEQDRPRKLCRQFLSQSSEQLELSESANRRRTELSPEDKVDDAARGSCRSVRDSFPSPCRCLAVRDHVPVVRLRSPRKLLGNPFESVASARVREGGEGKFSSGVWVASRVAPSCCTCKLYSSFHMIRGTVLCNPCR